jgi:hypothetical protein
VDDRLIRVQFSAGAEMYLFPTAFRMSSGPIQPPVLSLGEGKQARNEDDCSPPSRGKVKNVWMLTTAVSSGHCA